MASITSSSSKALDDEDDLPTPSAAQKKVLKRIEAQRERLRARRAAQAQTRALVQQRAAKGIGSLGALGGVVDDSVALRTASFAREHPLVLAALAAAAVLLGPRRLIRWTGVVLPLVMRLRR